MSNLRFVEKLANAPWMCTPEHLEFLHSIFVSYLDRSAAGQRLDVQAIEQAIGRPLDNTREVTVRSGVARIPVEGTIMRRASLFTEMSGGVSTETLTKDFITAYNDATVHSILFVFDSPGGEAHGIGELAEIIREKRDEGTKRIEAYCDGDCASAAYFLASATSKITTDQRATVGSIGTVVRVKNPDAVKTKADLEFWNSRSPKKRLNPNTQMGREAIQGFIDDMGDEFIAAVADNRGVSAETVERDFGQGFVMTGRRAVDVGMADALGSEESVIASLIERERSPQTIGVAAVHEQGHEMRSGVLATQDKKEEELTTQVQQGETSEAEAATEEESARGVVASIRRLLLGGDATPGAAVAVAEAIDERTEEPAEDGTGEPGEESDDGMSETQTQEAARDSEANDERSEVTDTQMNGNEAPVTREEFERLQAELQTERTRNAQTSAVLRERGIDRLLATHGSVVLENGARGAMPKAQRDAAKSLISALAEGGSDPIELSASGEAVLADNDAGKAVAQLIAPWKPVELGERGTQEGEAQSEGPQGDHERVMAELEARGLGKEHYAAVAGELAAKGEIRRED